MTHAFFFLLTLIFAALCIMQAIYGLSFYYLLWISWRHRFDDPPPPRLKEYPGVTVQLPIYNEAFVAARAIRSLAQLDWPNLTIQILDDSTDHTSDIVREVIAEYADRPIRFQHIRRGTREGFKAGALAYGMTQTDDDYFAIFDADFLPNPHFLKRMMPYIVAEPSYAFVQARWGHLNPDDSILTRIQSVSIDGHFMVEQFARSRGKHFFNFNGTAGIWRRTAIEDGGGWHAKTLTEDLELSYRCLMRGWDALLIRDVVVRAELPNDVMAYRRQQSRWAQGSIKCLELMIPQVMKSSANWLTRWQGIMHLSGYGFHLVLFSVALCYPLVLLAGLHYDPRLPNLYGLAPFLMVTTFAPGVFFLYGQHLLGKTWWKQFPTMMLMWAVGQGLMLIVVRATVKSLLNKGHVFERTPKTGAAKQRQQYRVPIDGLVWLEIPWGIFNMLVSALAWLNGYWAIGIFAGMFGIGALFMVFIVFKDRLGSGPSEPAPVTSNASLSVQSVQ
jgi:cellulose synthase/poly-beta-1,6-N-acetylglucosamine synthase-like glycosyltransferase